MPAATRPGDVCAHGPMMSCVSRPAASQRRVVLEHPRQEDVVPAADELHGRRDLRDVLGDSRAPPSRRRRACGLAIASRNHAHLGAGRERVEVGERQLVQPLRQPRAARGRSPAVRARRSCTAMSASHEADVSSARLPPGYVCAVKLRGRDLDRERRDVVAGRGRDGPLHEAEVARADEPDPLAVPGLRADPVERRQAVVALVERVEVAAGAERAARALDDDLQPALGERAAEDEPEHLAAAVRRAHEHRRLRRVARRARDPAVGQQHDAVVHRHAQVLLADDVLGLGAGQAGERGEQRAGEAHRRALTASGGRAPLRLGGRAIGEV